jgi:hypothetical protein
VNRREFLRGGAIATAFGWLGLGGMVRAEEPDTYHVHFTEEEVVWQSRPLEPDRSKSPFVRLDVSYRWFTAKDDAPMAVYMGDEDISDFCVAFYGPAEPYKIAWGKARVIDLSTGYCRLDADQNPITCEREGYVRWEPCG